LVTVNGSGSVTGVDFGISGRLQDFGDAPTPYPTTTAENGASYGLLSGFGLGAPGSPDVVDGEMDAVRDAQGLALGDNNNGANDENGVVFATQLFAGIGATVNVSVSLGGQSRGLLQAWIDFNRDGDWGEANEQIFRDLRLGEGVHVLNFTVPAGAVTGPTFARFRYGWERGIGPTGPGMAGEVEDYAVNVRGNYPVANDDTYRVTQGSSAFSMDVLVNDLPSANGALVISSVGATSNGGTVIITPDQQRLLYSPNPNFAGLETFTYTARDPAGQTDTATVSVTVTPTFAVPIAVDDWFGPTVPPPGIQPNPAANRLNVMANDIPGAFGPIRLIGVTQPTNGATSIDNNATPLDPSDDVILYTANPGFNNLDMFTYTIMDAAGSVSSAKVSVQVPNPDPTADDVMRIILETTDLAGNPISTITVGQNFKVRVSLADIRPVNGLPAAQHGVYAAFYDLLYNAARVSVAGDPNNLLSFTQFDADYDQGRSGNGATPGIIDELGSLQDGFTPLGVGAFEQLTVTFTANSPGVATYFFGDPADVLPSHDCLLHGSDDPVPASQITYVPASITILGAGGEGEFTNSANRLDVNADGAVSPIDALIVVNYLNANGSGPVGAAAAVRGAAEGEQTQRPHYFVDPTGDGYVSPLDALLVINYLNSAALGAQAAAEGEMSASALSGEGESAGALPRAGMAAPQLQTVRETVSPQWPQLGRPVVISTGAVAPAALGTRTAVRLVQADSPLKAGTPLEDLLSGGGQHYPPTTRQDLALLGLFAEPATTPVGVAAALEPLLTELAGDVKWGQDFCDGDPA
jgi:hypothetical protein